MISVEKKKKKKLFNDNINTNANTEVGRDAWVKCDMGGLAFAELLGFVIIQLGFWRPLHWPFWLWRGRMYIYALFGCIMLNIFIAVFAPVRLAAPNFRLYFSVTFQDWSLVSSLYVSSWVIKDIWVSI